MSDVICTAYAVKYSVIEQYDDYILVSQNRTKRRIPKGYYFEDTGTHIYISSFYAGIFQHKAKPRRYILNKDTKEWKEIEEVTIEHHRPDYIVIDDLDDEIDNLKRF